MKKISFYLLLGISLISQPAISQTGNQKGIMEVCQELNSINPSDENYSDLTFLKKDLKDVEVVLIGEQGHGAGSSFAAKSRLVKFLHQEMDYDVLVFESSILDCHIAWEEIKKGEDPFQSFGKGAFKFWTISEYTTELINYLGDLAQTDNPLILSGFDMQFSGMMGFEERAQHIIEFLKEGPSEVHIENLHYINEYLQNPYRFFKPKAMLDVDSTYRAALSGEFVMVAELWEKQQWAFESAAISRFFANTPKLMHFIWNLDMNNIDPDIANIRDQVMAENLIWLKEKVYPGKKLILWGANSHFGYNRNFLEPGDNMIPMAQYLKDRYDHKIYSLATTSFDGLSGSIVRDTITIVPEASGDCLEAILVETGYEYGFINLRSKKAKKYLEEPIKARLYGYGNHYGEWAKMADGLLFIKTMEPNVAREN